MNPSRKRGVPLRCAIHTAAIAIYTTGQTPLYVFGKNADKEKPAWAGFEIVCVCTWIKENALGGARYLDAVTLFLFFSVTRTCAFPVAAIVFSALGVCRAHGAKGMPAVYTLKRLFKISH